MNYFQPFPSADEFKQNIQTIWFVCSIPKFPVCKWSGNTVYRFHQLQISVEVSVLRYNIVSHFFNVLVWRSFVSNSCSLTSYSCSHSSYSCSAFPVLVPSFPIRVLSFPIRVRSFPIVFYHFLFVFTYFPFMFTRFIFVFSISHSCSPFPIRVLFVFSISHSCSFVFHPCSHLCGVLDLIATQKAEV